MILFWNNTYYSELAKGNASAADIFHPMPPYYYVINYIVGLVFLSSFFIGISLNPFVIMFNWSSKRSKLISRLFTANATADFIVCILIPMFYAVLMVQPRIVFYDYMYEMYIVCVMCTCGCTSQVCTTLLGVCRFVKIYNPFYRIKTTPIFLYLGSHIITMFIMILWIVLVVLGKLSNDGNVVHKLIISCFVSLAIHCIVGSVSSGLAVVLLVNNSILQEDKSIAVEKQKSAVTIFLMNIPHFVTVGCIFTSLVSPQGISWFDINFIFCPIVTSTLNPLLIVSRGSTIQRMIREYSGEGCMGVLRRSSSRAFASKSSLKHRSTMSTGSFRAGALRKTQGLMRKKKRAVAFTMMSSSV